MKIRVDRDALVEAVTWTARSLPAKPVMPVMAGLLLEATPDGVLRLSGFDYEVSARVEVSAEVLDGGTVLVSGKLLADICRSLPAKPVDVSTSGSRVSLTCGASRFTLLTMPVEEYPTLPAMPDGSGSFPGDVIASAINQVAIAASRDGTLPVLAGIRCEFDGQQMTLLATDRYRLAVRTIQWSPATTEPVPAVLVRARTLTEVAKSFGSGTDMTFGVSDSHVGFEAGGRRVTSLLVDGEYPKARSLFPAESPTYAVVEAQHLVEAVRRVALVAERHTPVRLTFTEGAITVEAGRGEDAQASEAVEATLVGDELSIAFNPQFLLDGLGALTTPFARLSFTVPTKPAVISGQPEADGEDDDSYRYLIMPVRLP